MIQTRKGLHYTKHVHIFRANHISPSNKLIGDLKNVIAGLHYCDILRQVLLTVDISYSQVLLTVDITD